MKKSSLLSKLFIGLIVGGLWSSSYAFELPWNKSESEKKDSTNAGPSVPTVDAQPIQQTDFTVSFAPVVKKVAHSVVNIFTSATIQEITDLSQLPFFNDPFFRRFFGDDWARGPKSRTRKEQSLGSGVIVTKDGYILTNHHVVDHADEIKVFLPSTKKEYAAKVIGKDRKTDLAVLKIEADKLTPIEFGDSEKIEVGDVVLAIGNPFGVGQSVTMGIISALGRSGLDTENYEDFIQTDAPINPGNSGGALVDAHGRVVGINTAILSRSGGNQGVGFAVPINLARNIMERLIKDGKVIRGALGIGIQDITPELAQEFKLPEQRGALISQIQPNSAAAAAGLKEGDTIIAVNNKKIEDTRQLRLLIGQLSPKTKVNLTYIRDGKENTVEVTLKELSDGSSPEESDVATTEDHSELFDGVELMDLDSNVRQQYRIPNEINGIVVTDVEPDSTAARVGIGQGDVIVEINRKPIKNVNEALDIAHKSQGPRFLLRIWRNGAFVFRVITVSK